MNFPIEMSDGAGAFPVVLADLSVHLNFFKMAVLKLVTTKL